MYPKDFYEGLDRETEIFTGFDKVVWTCWIGIAILLLLGFFG